MPLDSEVNDLDHELQFVFLDIDKWSFYFFGTLLREKSFYISAVLWVYGEELTSKRADLGVFHALDMH